jgi:hypothetical protein
MDKNGLIIPIRDYIHQKDSINIRDGNLFSRTLIRGGYDYYVDRNGISQLGEVLFQEHNSLVLGGAIYTLEKLFNVQSSLSIDYLNTIMSIANDGTPITEIYPKDNKICLFGIGIGGCGDTITSVKDVKIYEREIMDMIPFRVTDQPLTEQELTKYWFRKTTTDGKTAYYLKTFETTPVIKSLWKDAEGDEDGTEVQAGVHNTTRTEPIETFIELILTITKKDVREWFELNGNIEQTRINSVGLFSGIVGTLADGTRDYKQVKLICKFNMGNEPLNLSKDLTIIYRIYTS